MKTIQRLPAVCCAPGSPPLPEPVRRDLARRFRALGDPARVHIVNRLSAEEELCVCVLQAELGLSQPTISHHLKVLREADLVESRKRGTWSYYRLRPAALDELAAVIGG
jgi:ArsR family transcriptional regulator